MPINVIIIEGDKKYLEYLKILLNGPKIIKVIGTFMSGKKALNAIPNTAPDVIMVDLVLPDISGAELIKKIKMFSPEIDVLVFTKFGDEEHLFSALEAGADGYLLKDAKPADLIEAISEVYKGHSPMSGKIARRVLQEFRKSPKVNGLSDTKLTPRETEVLNLLSRGDTKKEIAKELSIKYETIRSHLKHIYKKLHAHSIPDAIAKGKDKGLI